MTSEKQAEANRRNALKSTGPRTPEGKNAVRLNALKHGLLSQEILLPGEDEETLRELGEHLRAELKPVGVLESLLVDRIVSGYWRLRRMGQVEVGIFDSERLEVLAEQAHREAQQYEFHPGNTLFDGWRVRKEDYEKYDEALERTRRLRSEGGDETTTLGRIFVRDANNGNAFTKLSRYETSRLRSIREALNELRDLQATRRADSEVPAPSVKDVDVSGFPGDEA